MAKFNEQQIADLYESAVAAEAAQNDDPDGMSGEAGFALENDTACLGGFPYVIRVLIEMLRESDRKLIAPLPIGELLQRLRDQCIGDEYVSLRDLQLSFECLPRYGLSNEPWVYYEDVRKLLGSAAKPSDHLANAQRLAREAGELAKRLDAPDALNDADAAGLIPWRSAKVELPDYPRDGYVPLCIVQIFFYPDAEARPFLTEKAIVWDWYNFRSSPRDGQSPGYWEGHDGFVLHWCYATDLIKTIPEGL
jgi:hypothetical protein